MKLHMSIVRHAITSVTLVTSTLTSHPAAIGQSKPAEFDVVSIKPHSPADNSGGMRTLPDDTFIMTGLPISSVILSASSVGSREVEGLPDRAKSERYDITVKPPPGSTREQRDEMWRTMFADRMKLAAHVEERERNTFALVVARSDGRLGPNLKPSTLDCNPPAQGTPPPPPPPRPSSPNDFKNRCGGMFGQGVIVSGGMTMDRLVLSLRGLAGGEVEDRTGLQGSYAFELHYSRQRLGAAPDASAALDDAPEFFTAIEEQLGLKLMPQKKKLPIFIVDHIERPSEN